MYVFYDSNGKITAGVAADSPNVVLTRIPDGTTPLYLDDTKYSDVWSNMGEYMIQNGSPVYTPIPGSVKLSNAQQSKIAQLESARDATLTGGFTSTSTGHTYVTTTNGEANMHGDLTRFTLDSTLTTVQFYTIDAGWVAHTQSQLQSAFLDGGKWKDAQYAQCNTLIAQVNAATTVSAVEAIQWTAASY